MKKTNMQKKLQLNRVTVRPLTAVELNAVVGGVSPNQTVPTQSGADDGNACGTKIR